MNNQNKTPEDQAAEQNEQATQEAAPEQLPEQPDEQKAAAPARKALTPVEAIEGPEDVIDWLKENATPIAVGLVIAALVFSGVTWFRNKKQTTERAAQKDLFSAQQSAQLSDVLAKYPNTPSAALAEIALGSQLFDEGRFDQARTTFGGFLQKNPGHALSASAEIGSAKCDEAQAKYDLALAAYDRFLKANKQSYALADAVFGKARCLTQLGRFDDARTTLEDFIAGNPGSPWLGRAQTEILYVGKARRSTTAPAPVVQPAPPAVKAPAP